ncbi:MAG: protein kinase [Alphaproteobacteria bacterium]|nr:protein kinase [Alphaproteobacteria bacterium]
MSRSLHDLTPGHIIAGYQLIRPLGEGGYGRVWLARREEKNPLGVSLPASPESKVALKIIHGADAHARELINEWYQGRFVQHPNVVRVIDVSSEGPLSFLAMEYVEGLTFSQLVRTVAGRTAHLPPDVVAELGIQVCQGLGAVHNATDEAGHPLEMVHRDIKPDNLMLDRHGLVKLLDFGIAKGARSLTVTRMDVVKGSPLWMAPEQHSRGVLAPTADIFSVGVVFFEMLTHEQLFSARDVEELVAIKRAGYALERVGKLRDRLGPFTPILQRCLQTEPTARFPDVDALDDAFRAALHTLPRGPGLKSLAGLLYEQRVPTGPLPGSDWNTLALSVAGPIFPDPEPDAPPPTVAELDAMTPPTMDTGPAWPDARPGLDALGEDLPSPDREGTQHFLKAAPALPDDPTDLQEPDDEPELLLEEPAELEESLELELNPEPVDDPETEPQSDRTPPPTTTEEPDLEAVASEELELLDVPDPWAPTPTPPPREADRLAAEPAPWAPTPTPPPKPTPTPPPKVADTGPQQPEEPEELERPASPYRVAPTLVELPESEPEPEPVPGPPPSSTRRPTRRRWAVGTAVAALLLCSGLIVNANRGGAEQSQSPSPQPIERLAAPSATAPEAACPDQDGDGVPSCATPESAVADCDDADPTVHPGAPELCDGQDNDCDGRIRADERDGDGDGWAPCEDWPTEADPAPPAPDNAELVDLTEDFIAPTAGGDCDDTRASIHPGAEELLDGADTNCDGDMAAFENDRDGDGSPDSEDCAPNDPTRYPDADEIPADGIDQDCDGQETCYLDQDGDGVGGPWKNAVEGLKCERPGFAWEDEDCNDHDPTMHPGRREICDDLRDNDCDGATDGDDEDCPSVDKLRVANRSYAVFGKGEVKLTVTIPGSRALCSRILVNYTMLGDDEQAGMASIEADTYQISVSHGTFRNPTEVTWKVSCCPKTGQSCRVVPWYDGQTVRTTRR